MELEATSEAPWTKNGLRQKARELRLAADMAAHRAAHNPTLRDGCKYLADAYDDAAALIEDRVAAITLRPKGLT